MSKQENSATQHLAPLPNMSGYSFVIITAAWNAELTKKMEVAAIKTLTKHKVKKGDIQLIDVPGSFELVYAAQRAIKKYKPDAVICIGCIIKGETPHDIYISQAVANGIMNLNVNKSTPVIFGVLTTNNIQQARERAGGKMGNKGEDAALAAMQMALLNS